MDTTNFSKIIRIKKMRKNFFLLSSNSFLYCMASSIFVEFLIFFANGLSTHFNSNTKSENVIRISKSMGYG